MRDLAKFLGVEEGQEFCMNNVRKKYKVIDNVLYAWVKPKVLPEYWEISNIEFNDLSTATITPIIKLSEVERILLENVSEEYKDGYITRDGENAVEIFTEKPNKLNKYWTHDDGHSIDLSCFNHLFKFITWKDEEPWKISDLLGLDKGE